MWNVLLELAPWLLLGTAVASGIHVFLPEDFLKRQFSGSAGVLKAVSLGVPLPLCSCGVIPVGLGMKTSGASDGAVVGFLISTPQTGVDSILVSASFLGWPFAIFKLLSAAIMGLLGGGLTNWLGEGGSGNGCFSRRPAPESSQPYLGIFQLQRYVAPFALGMASDRHCCIRCHRHMDSARCLSRIGRLWWIGSHVRNFANCDSPLRLCDRIGSHRRRAGCQRHANRRCPGISHGGSCHQRGHARRSLSNPGTAPTGNLFGHRHSGEHALRVGVRLGP